MPRIKCLYCTDYVPDNLMQTHMKIKHKDVLEAKVNEVLPPPPPIVEAPVSPVEVVGMQAAEPVLTTREDSLFIPDPDPHFVVPDDLIEFLRTVEKLCKEKPRKVKLTGPQGAGKTSLARQHAAIYKRPTYIAACVTMQEQSQWFGQWGVNPEKGTFYLPAEFVKAIETPHACIILDDMNRVENPKVLNPLLPLLDTRGAERSDDGRGWVYLDEFQRRITVAEDVIFFGTVNEGAQYQGTDPIDVALSDRFFPVAVDYPSELTIKRIITSKTRIDWQSADLIARYAEALANPAQKEDAITLSMRRILDMSELVAGGMNVRNAAKFCFQAELEKEQLEHALAGLQLLLTGKCQSCGHLSGDHPHDLKCDVPNCTCKEYVADYEGSTPKWETWVS